MRSALAMMFCSTVICLEGEQSCWCQIWVQGVPLHCASMMFWALGQDQHKENTAQYEVWTHFSARVFQHWDVFKVITEVFILVPALVGLKGNLEMTLASRLSTAVRKTNKQLDNALLYVYLTLAYNRQEGSKYVSQWFFFRDRLTLGKWTTPNSSGWW